MQKPSFIGQGAVTTETIAMRRSLVAAPYIRGIAMCQSLPKKNQELPGTDYKGD